MRTLFLSTLLLCSLSFARAQSPAAPEPDVLLLTDGEKLTGHLLRATGGSIRFKSDALGELTIDWSKIKELRAAGKFAVIAKDVKLGRGGISGGLSADVPQGTLAVVDNKIDVATPAGAKTVPVADATHVIDLPTFERVFSRRQAILEGWHGTVTGGASLVEATQTARTFTESATLVRGVPTEDWLPRRNRTTVNISSSYGTVTQPLTPTVKTSIFHADAERDEYFSASAYGFGQTLFDHNFSQGLRLQQTYVGGIGWTAIRRPTETLDLKAGFSFIRQQFAGATISQNLASSVFDERFMRKFNRGITFTQQLSVSPAWSNTRALSALGNATLAMPVYKRLNFTLGVIENFLNDPPPGFRKNSFQFFTGLTYVLP